MQITALITYTPQKAPKGKKYGRPYVVLLSDQSTLLNTSLAKNCSWEYRERLERGSNADPAIDYDPLRLHVLEGCSSSFAEATRCMSLARTEYDKK